MAKSEDKRRALNRAIDKAGGITRVAASLGVTVQAVQNWRSRGIPLAKALQLSDLTGIPVSRLRPEIQAKTRAHG